MPGYVAKPPSPLLNRSDRIGRNVLAAWLFDGPNLTTLRDHARRVSGNSGTLVGTSTSATSGVWGREYPFSGSVNFNASPANRWPVLSGITIGALIVPSVTSSMRVFAIERDVGAGNSALSLAVGRVGSLIPEIFYRDSVGSLVSITGPALTSGRPYALVGLVGPQGGALVVNGATVASSLTAPGSATWAWSSTPVRIGCAPGGATEFFVGSMSALAVLNRRLFLREAIDWSADLFRPFRRRVNPGLLKVSTPATPTGSFIPLLSGLGW